MSETSCPACACACVCVCVCVVLVGCVSPKTSWLFELAEEGNRSDDISVSWWWSDTVTADSVISDAISSYYWRITEVSILSNNRKYCFMCFCLFWVFFFAVRGTILISLHTCSCTCPEVLNTGLIYTNSDLYIQCKKIEKKKTFREKKILPPKLFDMNLTLFWKSSAEVSDSNSVVLDSDVISGRRRSSGMLCTAEGCVSSLFVVSHCRSDVTGVNRLIHTAV